MERSIKRDSVVKAKSFTNKVLLVNGWEGCGKTCISSIFKSIKNSEVMRYSYEFEWICSLWLAKKLDTESASNFLKGISDVLIYNHLQSREVNFRPNDISSIFRSPIWFKYIQRLFNEGGEKVGSTINEHNILHIVTHDLFECRDLLYQSFGSRLAYIEVVRDPLYMLKQAKYNQDTLYRKNSPRHFHLIYKHTGLPVYDGLNVTDESHYDNWELAVRFLERRMAYYFRTTSHDLDKPGKTPIFIFFEDFVIDPMKYLYEIESRFEIYFGKNLKRYLRIEKVPRSHHSDAKRMKIYKKIGWVRLRNKDEKGIISDRESYLNHYKEIGVPDYTINKLIVLSENYRKWKTSLQRTDLIKPN